MSSGIIRIEHDRDRPYVVVSKALSEDRRLSFALRGVLVYLLGKHDNWTTYMTEVEAAGAEGREAMKAIFQEGRKFGYIRTIEHREKGRLSYEHIIYERPLETPVPHILTPDGKPSSVLKRQQKAAGAPKKPKSKSPSTGSRQREAVNGSPSTETRQVISNDGSNNDDQKREAPAVPALAPPPQVEVNDPSHPADAGAADAAGQDIRTPSQDQPGSEEGQDDQATDTDVLPGAAAGRTAEQRAETEAFLKRKLSPKFVSSLLEEIQPLGLERQQDWFDLPLERVKELLEEARRTHETAGVKVPTRVRDLLDAECRQINLARRGAQTGAGRAAPVTACRAGEVRLDPQGHPWTVEDVKYGRVIFEELDAPRDLLDEVVATWACAPAGEGSAA